MQWHSAAYFFSPSLVSVQRATRDTSDNRRLLSTFDSTGAVQADYFQISVFYESDCTGPSTTSIVTYPTGCFAVSPESLSLNCLNSTYGQFRRHLNDKCTGPGIVVPGMNDTGGCSNGQMSNTPALGVGMGGISFLYECVASAQPYEPPLGTVAYSTFTPQSTCPGSLLGAGNVVDTVYVYKIRECEANAPTSRGKFPRYSVRGLVAIHQTARLHILPPQTTTATQQRSCLRTYSTARGAWYRYGGLCGKNPCSATVRCVRGSVLAYRLHAHARRCSGPPIFVAPLNDMTPGTCGGDSVNGYTNFSSLCPPI